MISVVVPTCQRNEALAQCLDRLAPGAQTLDASQYEVIVTDDGSKSTAQAMIRERYSWARWVAGPRRGPAANRNCGARLAQGEFLAFTDDDCLPSPDWLRAYAAAIRENVEIYEGATAATGPLQGPFVGAPVNLKGGSLWSCNMMVSQGVFARLEGFDEGFPGAADEDVDFHRRAHARGEAIDFVPDALVLHPPVRRVWGRKTARMWESQVRLVYKADPSRPAFTRYGLVWYALNTRARQLWRAPLSLDWLLGVCGLIVELIWIARHARRWEHKHRADLASARQAPRAA